MKDDIDLIPEDAGVLIVGPRGAVSQLRTAKLNKAAVSLDAKTTVNLARLGMMRIWNLKKALMNLSKNYADLQKRGMDTPKP